MERRRARRFALGVPVVFQWEDEVQPSVGGGGFTRDISVNGLFVLTACPAPPLASNLDLTVLLPSLNAKGPGMLLRASGSVVRVQPTREGVGIGIASALGYFGDSDQAAFSLTTTTAALPCS